MVNTNGTPTSGLLNFVTFIVWLVAICAVIDWSFFHRDKPPRLQELVEENYKTLSKVVGHKNTYSPTNGQKKEKRVFDSSNNKALLAIVGDGIAGVAAAINSPITDVRLFGSRSYWEELHGMPEVWQSTTSLDKAFAAAHFEKPSAIDKQEKGANSTRLLWIAVERSRLLALENQLNEGNGFHYARSGRSSLSLDTDAWLVSDALGNRLSTKGPIILATGIAKPSTIVERLGGSDDTARQPLYKTRHALVVDKKIIGSDDYFAIPAPLDDLKTVGILGAGGAAWDVALHAIESGKAEKVVVFGAENPSTTNAGLYANAAFKKLQDKHGAKICTVAGEIKDVKYESVEEPVGAPNIVVTIMKKDNKDQAYGNEQFSCIPLKQGDDISLDRIDKLVEALGRAEGGTAEILEPLGKTLGGISYEICKNGDKKWVGARVSFNASNNGENKPPNNLYLIGAMAASALKITPMHPAWTNLLEEFSDDIDLQKEHPPHGFAGAAYTGSQLVRCFDDKGNWEDKCLCEPPSEAIPKAGSAK